MNKNATLQNVLVLIFLPLSLHHFWLEREETNVDTGDGGLVEIGFLDFVQTELVTSLGLFETLCLKNLHKFDERGLFGKQSIKMMIVALGSVVGTIKNFNLLFIIHVFQPVPALCCADVPTAEDRHLLLREILPKHISLVNRLNALVFF